MFSSKCGASMKILCMCGMQEDFRTRTSTLLLNLDTNKAFNLMTWDYLLWFEIGLRHFSPLHPLESSSKRGARFANNAWGLLQVGPLSRLKFFLAIELLQSLLHRAAENCNLHRLTWRDACICISLYGNKPDVHWGSYTGVAQHLAKPYVQL